MTFVTSPEPQGKRTPKTFVQLLCVSELPSPWLNRPSSASCGCRETRSTQMIGSKSILFYSGNSCIAQILPREGSQHPPK